MNASSRLSRCGDLVEPGAKRALALEPRQSAPGAHQRFLESVLGVVDRAQHPVAVRVELAAMGFDERAVGVLVAPTRRLEELLLWSSRAHPGQTRPTERGGVFAQPDGPETAFGQPREHHH